MKIEVLTQLPENFPGQTCTIVGVTSKQAIKSCLPEVSESVSSRVSHLFENKVITGKIGQATMLIDESKNSQHLLVVGLGENDALSRLDFGKVLSSISNKLKEHNIKNSFDTLISDLIVEKLSLEQTIKQATLKLQQDEYEFTKFKTEKSEKDKNTKTINYSLIANQSDIAQLNETVKTASAMAVGSSTARDLGNTPSNVCTPSYIADYSLKLAEKFEKLSVEVLEEKDMAALNMGSFLSVAKGSIEPPKLVVLDYQGGKESEAPIVLVGKGITFDTGGVSLKPAGSMINMKFDMCGAASVVGTIHAIAQLGLKVNVKGVLACAENMPSDRSSKPDDIVTSMSGMTIEIANTDAEGRLVLCDAMTYSKKFKPKAMIDIATLTGACVIALGSHASALYSNDEELSNNLVQAGEEVHDRAWKMPLWDDYQDQLKSPVADVCNVSSSREAGSITAACFLSRFVKDIKWAHMDIAGTAQNGKEVLATGRPVPLLTQFLIDQATA